MTFEIDDNVLPKANGRARRGPRLHPLDSEAVEGIGSGLYPDEFEAAKALAPRYRSPQVWAGLSKEQKRDYIKSKRRQYAKMMARLAPSRA